MDDESYLSLLTRELTRLKRLADGAMSQTSDEALFMSVLGSGTSLATVVKHMSGNMHSRWQDFLTSDGEKPSRHRDEEFEISSEDTREHLRTRWESGWALFLKTVSSLSTSDLERTVTIRGEPLTVLQAVNRQITHYAYHVGQIVVLAKQQCGETWNTLSVARGESAEFNKNPKRYLSSLGRQETGEADATA